MTSLSCMEGERELYELRAEIRIYIWILLDHCCPTYLDLHLIAVPRAQFRPIATSWTFRKSTTIIRKTEWRGRRRWRKIASTATSPLLSPLPPKVKLTVSPRESSYAHVKMQIMMMLTKINGLSFCCFLSRILSPSPSPPLSCVCGFVAQIRILLFTIIEWLNSYLTSFNSPHRICKTLQRRRRRWWYEYKTCRT